MAEKPSLLTGRNVAPLQPEQIRRATQTFLTLDSSVNARHVDRARTVFRVSVDEDGHHFGEVVFGPDIYPGPNIINPNSALSLRAAAAHELSHFHRWNDMAALSDDGLEHVDEALTSLQAACRYQNHLNPTEIQQLIGDAIERLHLFVRDRQQDIKVPAEKKSDSLSPDATAAAYAGLETAMTEAGNTPDDAMLPETA